MNTNLMEETKLLPPEPSEQEGIIQRLRGWIGASISGKQPEGSLKEALEDLLEEHQEEEGVVHSEEQNILKNVLNLGELEVRDVMTSRSDIKAIEYHVTLPELTNYLIECEHTRLPVYNDTLDNIKGFVHSKDLVPFLAERGSFNMALVLRDVLFIPPSMKLTNILLKMRQSGVHMGIVIDEYGGTDGLITLEDIFEEIVGEIQDEHDEQEHETLLQWSSEGFCDVDARTVIEKLETDLQLSLRVEEDEDTDYETIAGFILYQIDHIPVTGEIIEAANMRFEILDADPRIIKSIRIYAPVAEVKEA